MKKTSIVTAFFATLLLVLAGCATLQSVEHKHIMKGQVLDVSNGQAVLCIGSADGAKEGQQFPVYRYERSPSASPKETSPSFKRVEVGSLQITQVFDVHYAKASILGGDIKEHDVAELGR